jgi:hypothetical protein
MIEPGMIIELYTPSAPAQGAARAWVRNRDVWIVVRRPGRMHNIRSPLIVDRHYCGRADSRYTGERSAYGQAIARALEMMAELQAEQARHLEVDE